MQFVLCTKLPDFEKGMAIGVKNKFFQTLICVCALLDTRSVMCKMQRRNGDYNE